jgi:tetratricopeptide (TPR) repeat protein
VLKAADPDPWRQRLRVVLRTEDPREAQRLADEAVVARQPPWTLLLLSKVLRTAGPRQGLALMRRAQAQYPGDFWVNFHLAWLLEQDPDKTDDPVRFYSVAVALRPGSALVRYNLAMALAKRGEVDKGITLLRQVASVKPDVAVFHFGLGWCLQTKGDREGAIQAYRRALQLDPDSVGVCKNLGQLLGEKADQAGVNEVIAKLRRIVQRKPNEPDAFLALGDLLRKKQDRDGALAAYRRAKDTLPRDNFDAHFKFADHLKDEGVFDEALAAFQYCAELAAKTKRPDQRERAARAIQEIGESRLLTAGRAHARRREWEKAARCYAPLPRRDRPPGDEICFERAAVLLLSGDDEGYRRACARMIARCGKKGFRAFLAARACTLAPGSREMTARAGQLAEKELTANPRAFWLLTEQAALHYRAGRFDRALPLLEQSLKLDPRPGSAVLNRLWLALTCQRLGQKPQGRSWLEEATKFLDQYREGLRADAEQRLGLHLHNWLEAHVLRREAEALLSWR